MILKTNIESEYIHIKIDKYLKVLKRYRWSNSNIV